MGERLKNKVAVVMGAGSSGPGWGNGKATAVLFAREGAKVFAIDINPAAVEETAQIINDEGGNCTVHETDVTRADQVQPWSSAASKPMAVSTFSTTTSASWKSADRWRPARKVGTVSRR
jgi:NAD(P)-dependent dehydrogenase (short-subunit alcohol dehydrogenase family)